MLAEGLAPDAKIKKMDVREMRNTIKNIDGTGIKYHNYADIGKYTVFPK